MRPYSTRAVALAVAALMAGGLLATPTQAWEMPVTPPAFSSSENVWEWAEDVSFFGSTSKEEADRCANPGPADPEAQYPDIAPTACSAREISFIEAFFAKLIDLIGRLASSSPR